MASLRSGLSTALKPLIRVVYPTTQSNRGWMLDEGLSWGMGAGIGWGGSTLYARELHLRPSRRLKGRQQLNGVRRFTREVGGAEGMGRLSGLLTGQEQWMGISGGLRVWSYVFLDEWPTNSLKSEWGPWRVSPCGTAHGRGKREAGHG